MIFWQRATRTDIKTDSAGHQRLTMVSDANVILESRRMKTLLDKW